MSLSDSDRKLRIERKTEVADDVVELMLVDPATEPLPEWEPGTHVVLQLPDGLIRQYSLCGPDRADGTWTIAVHKSPTSRGGSVYVHDELGVGTLIPVSGPYNNFPLVEAERYLLIAGGIGITPILAMVRKLRETGGAFEFVYCGRRRSLMAYHDEIASWEDSRVSIHADEERGGLLDLATLLEQHRGAVVYCCGPEAMISAVESQAPDPASVRVERFRSSLQNDTSGDTPFDVVLSGSGERHRVGASDSILETLEAAGYDLDFDCREGICSTCETRVVKGTPEHRDQVLSDEEHTENTVMMICVSRARSDEIVLDISDIE